MTREKSIRPAARSRSSISRCTACQTPARCHRRSRFSSVMPQQPNSHGKSSQAIPVLSTNRMPARHTRSATGGLPPVGRGSYLGSSGSTAAHKSSVTSGLAIASSVTTRKPLSITPAGPRRKGYF